MSGPRSALAAAEEINPALLERLEAYKGWKGRVGIEGTPTLEQFRNFARGNTGLNGGGFYPKIGDFGRLERVEELLAQTHGHHGFPQALEGQFNGIGIDIQQYVYPVNGYEHLVDIHGGVGGGTYNTWWRQFFSPRAPYGPATSENALQWLDVHRSNGFIIR